MFSQFLPTPVDFGQLRALGCGVGQGCGDFIQYFIRWLVHRIRALYRGQDAA